MNLAGTDILNQANERSSAKDNGGYTSGQNGYRQYSNQVPLIGQGTRPNFQSHQPHEQQTTMTNINLNLNLNATVNLNFAGVQGAAYPVSSELATGQASDFKSTQPRAEYQRQQPRQRHLSTEAIDSSSADDDDEDDDEVSH